MSRHGKQERLPRSAATRPDPLDIRGDRGSGDRSGALTGKPLRPYRTLTPCQVEQFARRRTRMVLRRTIGRPRPDLRNDGWAHPQENIPSPRGTIAVPENDGPFRHQHQPDEGQDRQSHQPASEMARRKDSRPLGPRSGRGASIVRPRGVIGKSGVPTQSSVPRFVSRSGAPRSIGRKSRDAEGASSSKRAR
jgi:hypothetical protein